MTSMTQDTYVFFYQSCRNISSPDDENANRKIYTGQAPASSVLTLEDNDNVREYLVEAKGKQRRAPTLVHQAIRKTLNENSSEFSILNGGMVIVARDAEVDDKNKLIRLKSPSIINGSQTQGELRRYFESYGGEPPQVPFVKYEIIVTEDDDLIAEISIARNFQNDVRPISIAGRRGQLDELEQSLQKVFPGVELRKSESDIANGDNFLDTEKLIQVTFALFPETMMQKMDSRADPSNKVFAYSQKTRCLKAFQRLVEDGPEDVYRCFLDLAPHAWKLYDDWKSHQGFRGTGIRSITREGSEILEVPDGIIFPIIAAYSAFAVQPTGSLPWTIKKPTLLKDSELIEVAKQTYMEVAGHNPQTMGKTKPCYSALRTITGIYARLNDI